ncbi:MAG: hypothetical protein ABSG35_21250 [Syntrophobacteraceae bacterium]
MIIACISLALLTVVGTTRAQADCCGFDLLAAPFVAAGAIAEGAAEVSAEIVTAPFTAFSCGNCGITLCDTYFPKVAFAPCGCGEY